MKNDYFKPTRTLSAVVKVAQKKVSEYGIVNESLHDHTHEAPMVRKRGKRERREGNGRGERVSYREQHDTHATKHI